MGLPLAVLAKGLRAAALNAGVALLKRGAKGQEQSQNPEQYPDARIFPSLSEPACLLGILVGIRPSGFLVANEALSRLSHLPTTRVAD
jgi:hypothetical protein